MRVLALVTAFACLAGALAGGAAARRPATKGELDELISPWDWGKGGNPAAVWISSNGRAGIVLVYPNSLKPAVLEAEAKRATGAGVVVVPYSGLLYVPSPALIPRDAKPLAAFLIWRGVVAGSRAWEQAAPKTFLRGPKLNRAGLRQFCAEVRQQAGDLAPSACG